MVTYSRARSNQAKAARRDDILGQTLHLWQRERYEDVTLQAVAASVGLTKAALYGYYPTKESLFLSLYETLLQDFLHELQKHLRLGGRHTPESLAELVSALFTEHQALTRLMPHLAGLLERNIPQERARQHKTWLLEQLHPVSAAVEAALDGLPPGGGFQLMVYTQALLAGLYPMSDPAPSVKAALQDPALAPLCIDLHTTLRAALSALYRGMLPSLPA